MPIKLKSPPASVVNVDPTPPVQETPTDPTPAAPPLPQAIDLKPLLPTVTVTGDVDALEAVITETPPSPETMVELIIYLSRLHRNLEAVAALETKVRAMLSDYYQDVPADQRLPVRSRAGTASYTPAGTKEAPKDRDAIVEILTQEQLRASYIPDLKALKIMLKPAVYAKLVTEAPTNPRVTIRDLGGDFSEF